MAKIRVFVLVTGLLALFSVDARAGGFATARFGGEYGHAASDSPTTIYYNPAGLALGTGTRLYVEGLFAWRSISYDRPPEAIDNIVDPGGGEDGTPSDALGVNSGEATLFNVLASPFLGAATDFGVPNLGVGFGFYVPFGGQARWDQNSEFAGDTTFPGAVDGVQRWSTIEGTLRSLYISLGGAYRLPGPGLSFGVSVNAIRSSVSTVRARLVDGTDTVVTANGEVAEGRSLIEVSALDFSVGAGVTWEPSKDVAIGLSYQSRPSFGEMTLDGELINKFGTGTVTNDDVILTQGIPDIVRLGVKFRPTSNLELRLAGDYTRWSAMQDQCLVDATLSDTSCRLENDGGFVDANNDGSPDSPGIIVNIHRDWSDTFGVRLGGSYWLSPKFEITASANFDSNAVPDETMDPALLDQNKFLLSAGIGWGIAEQLYLLASYTQVLYVKREIDVRMAPPPNPSRVPDSAGVYKQNLGFLQLGLQYAF